MGEVTTSSHLLLVLFAGPPEQIGGGCQSRLDRWCGSSAIIVVSPTLTDCVSAAVFGHRLLGSMRPDSNNDALGVGRSLITWGKPSRPHCGGELEVLQRIVEACRSRMHSELRALIRDNAGQPLLLSYSGDGTPLTCRKTVSSGAGALQVTRHTKKSEEYYVHHIIGMVKSTGGQLMCRIRLEDPRPMTKGRSAASEIAFAQSLIPDARQELHRGIVLQHCCWDRAKFDCLRRLRAKLETRRMLSSPGEFMPQAAEYLLTWHMALMTRTML